MAEDRSGWRSSPTGTIRASLLDQFAGTAAPVAEASSKLPMLLTSASRPPSSPVWPSQFNSMNLTRQERDARAVGLAVHGADQGHRVAARSARVYRRPGSGSPQPRFIGPY